MNTSLMFSSKTDQWPTPRAFFDRCNEEFSLELDVCADDKNHKCPRFYTEELDGLSREWAPSRCWMNPPYGREISAWVKKAWEESCRGSLGGVSSTRTDRYFVVA